MVGALLASVALPVPALAQQVVEGPATATAPDTGSQEIVVLGTRRTDRTLTDSASPVDIIAATEIQTQPSTNVIDVLKDIVPSFFVGQNTISDASTFVRSPSLRGLPGDEVLVQLNGKRFNRSALVQVYTGGDTGLSFGSQGPDLSSIPGIAVKNLQILREGATAQYGSDAIAGVLNFGLRDNKTGFEAIARYGQYYDHGDGRSWDIQGNLGLTLGSRGFVNISGEYADDAQTVRGQTRPIAVIFAQQNPNLASQLPNYPGPAQNWGSSPSHSWKTIVNAGYEVTDNSQLYFFGNAAQSYANESFNYRSPISGSATDVGGVTHGLGANGALTRVFYLTPCPAGNATCPAGGFVSNGQTFQFTSIYPAGFTPRFLGKTTELYGALGYKGHTDGGFTYDVSVDTSRNSLDLSMYDSLSPTYGPQSQTRFNFGSLIQKETDVNVDLTQSVNLGLASPLTIAAGGEYRHENYTATAGDAQSYGAGPFTASQPLYFNNGGGVYTPAGNSGGSSPGASGYGGTSPAAAGSFGQDSYAFYGNLEADLVKNLSAGVAGRYEHYNNFGGDFVYKVNALYKITDDFSIRGTVGSGFHAPSPGQSNENLLTTNFVGGNQVQTGTYANNTAIARYYGAKQLGPEKSFNYGIGFVAKPLHNLTVTVDGYSIYVKNRIGVTQNFTVTAADIAAQPALLSVGVGGAVNYFTNGFNSVTQGIDFVGTYHMGLIRPGDFNLTLAYNFNRSRVTRSDPGILSNEQIVDVAHLAPAHRIVLTGNWTHDRFSVLTRLNYYSSWVDAVDYPIYGTNGYPIGQVFKDKATVDLDVGYDITKFLTLSVGGTDIFNTKPDRIANTPNNPVYGLTGSTADGQVYPRSGGPFGINGGFWYVRGKVKF
ncbi:MAG: TonB-dependent receptor [Sphingomonadaceae bacterium]|nr:TonB-dependent receptor [Sphingomonadaceae bacterium]